MRPRVLGEITACPNIRWVVRWLVVVLGCRCAMWTKHLFGRMGHIAPIDHRIVQVDEHRCRVRAEQVVILAICVPQNRSSGPTPIVQALPYS